ncbi:MAG TPA: site-2 protease family protein [Rhodocyclaceae bacterium]|nr:site-2 protease family protein [Rhodocyclaceae bacterium]
MESLIQTLAISALPVIFAITLHEAAHGYVARHFGDMTAWQAGRISLNPIRHIDPIGTLLVPVLTMLLGGFVFGWAKPVPVNFGRLRNPKKDMFWVALAGPAANFLMALGWGLLQKLAELMPANAYSLPMAKMADAGMEWNIILMVLNLLPILPLDGGRIAVSLLPAGAAWRYARLEPWGLPILLLLIFTGVLGAVIGPLIGLVRFALAILFQFHY